MALAPCLIYDARGQLVATVDPITRARTPVTAKAARGRGLRLPCTLTAHTAHETDKGSNHPDNIPPLPQESPEAARAGERASSVRKPDRGSAPDEPSKAGESARESWPEYRTRWVRETHTIVVELDPGCPHTSDEFRAAVVLLGGWLGQSAAFLSRLTGEPIAWIRPLTRQWRAMGLWPRAGKPYFMGPLADAMMTDPEPSEHTGRSVLTFWLIIAAGLGHVRYNRQTDRWSAQ